MSEPELLLGRRVDPAEERAALDDVHALLVRRAHDAGLLDIAYRTVDSPVGSLLLAATPAGLVRVAFGREGHDAVLQTLAARVSPRVLHAPARLDPVVRQLEEYFGAHRHRFDVPLDLQLTSGFRHDVLEYLPHVGYGHTASYAAVAAGVGNPRAVRAVGTACATNPLPLVIPCHRVVRSDGTPGAYVGGEDAKRILLALETSGAGTSSWRDGTV